MKPISEQATFSLSEAAKLEYPDCINVILNDIDSPINHWGFSLHFKDGSVQQAMLDGTSFNIHLLDESTLFVKPTLMSISIQAEGYQLAENGSIYATFEREIILPPFNDTDQLPSLIHTNVLVPVKPTIPFGSAMTKEEWAKDYIELMSLYAQFLAYADLEENAYFSKSSTGGTGRKISVTVEFSKYDLQES